MKYPLLATALAAFVLTACEGKKSLDGYPMDKPPPSAYGARDSELVFPDPVDQEDEVVEAEDDGGEADDEREAAETESEETVDETDELEDESGMSEDEDEDEEE